MSVHRDELLNAEQARPPSSLENRLATLLYLNGENIAYMVIFVAAVLTRFWDLGARVMSHDESLHTRYSWNLYRGDGFAHTPLMHGPLLFHITALMYLLFGDNDFSARIYPAIVGIGVVMMPLLMRKWLGRMGALAASFLFLISPMILYYSRYIRHDMPAILFALVIVLCTWRYVENRENKYLIILAAAQACLYASKEVSFIYIAIFGSFLTLFFVTRLLELQWANRTAYIVFSAAVLVTVISLCALGIVTVVQPSEATALSSGETISPPEPGQATSAGATSGEVPDIANRIIMIVLAISVATAAGSVLVGRWKNLRKFPELDVMVVMGSLILPMLSPFLIHALGHNPLDETPEGIQFSLFITLPIVAVSVIAGLIWGIRPPQSRIAKVPTTFDDTGQHPSDPEHEIATTEVEIRPDLLDWVQAFFTSRWWAIGGIFWLIFIFFFTTMFTNGAGLGTGVVGSLGYWLEQQGVKRGGQPTYYYALIMVPLYEFLPLILSAVAGVIGIVNGVAKLFQRSHQEPEDQVDEAAAAGDPIVSESHVRSRALDTPIQFPVLLFVGYWVVLNFIAYSIAGEKMPWLTTHLTTPMILLGGWVLGRAFDRIEWKSITQSNAWVVLLLIPILAVSLLRVVGPICNMVALPEPPGIATGQAAAGEISWGTALLDGLRLPCNTIIPAQYQNSILGTPSLSDLYATYAWLAGAIVLAIAVIAILRFGRTLRSRQVSRLMGLGIVGWLVFLTAHTAWQAAYVNYDQATEFLVYAHSAGAVKEVMNQIDEISLKTTDGYGLRVAYDNRVSWPFSWYLRNYYNAIYYGDQPSRGLIGDAPVVLAGPDNWTKVEPLLGDRYYQFEYIRMWWPMQDYFNLTVAEFKTFFSDPALQRGVWNIFINRDYSDYASAVGRYRATVPTFELSEWPVAERMRLYIRKDVFAQVWDYGVAASEIASATDPYAAGQRQLVPAFTFGSGILSQPHGISIGPDGKIYVADSGNHRIAIFDVAGNLITSLGSQGLAPLPDVLNEPWDVAVSSDGTVFIADTWNNRIVKYSPQGIYINNWGFQGPNLNDPLGFWGPRGIAVDSQGSVYLADTGNKRIQVFSEGDFFQHQIGTGGGLEGQIDEPVGLAIGPDGLLYIADTWNQRVDVFTASGQFVRQWTVDAWYAQSNERPYIAVNADGNVFISDPDGSRIIAFDSTGRYLYSFGDYTTIGLAGGLAFAPDGSLLVSDVANGVVQKYDLSNVPSQ